ncbi:glutamate ABC transporter substrate-binding protein [Mycetocola tolaasinivorans]|uniref:Glutamate ABC transporter substrate-binding protein n=1 Tax=Mycetocola tolaasinivorans TaxID=76635 RepID=A0A3L7ADX8_9MICO|nr:glutamate ABC transporter substrate-binding protein [Mycetocola tolaasinivorans]RLP77851.1 glutamate ABC transporter substrate-binding protein [Mycetocola tolaasinivorans]
MKRSRLSLIALAGAAALVLSACSSSGDGAGSGSGGTGSGGGDDANPAVVSNPSFEAGTTMEKLSKAGKITVGVKFDQPLFGEKGLKGEEGFDVEIAKIIAGQLGIAADKIDWKEAVSANREPFIENGEVDIIVATYTINDKRKEVIDFAGPYYIAGQSLLVKADNNEIKSEKDIVGKPVCSVTGSTPAENLAKLGAETVLTDTYSNCLEPLRSGKVVAVSTDNVILAGLAAKNEGEFKLAGDLFTEEPYGIGLKKGDTAFKDFINKTLEDSYTDGAYKKAWDKTAGTILKFVDGPAITE